LPVGWADAPQAQTLAWLPAVGAVTGALAGTAAWAVALTGAHPLAVAVAFGASILLTGAIHIDGFLDSADALGASVPPERRLDIMKDPRHGTFAVAAFAVLCAIWLAALWAIPPARLPAALAWAAATARWCVVGIAWFVPYGRAGASVRVFERRPSLAVHLAMLALIAGLGWCAGWPVLGLVPPAAALAFGAAFAIRPLLGGGLTGDVYGAIVTALEVLVLVALPFVAP
jgi:adenosylcobinamide-GDP ribazoletransferase